MRFVILVPFLLFASLHAIIPPTAELEASKQNPRFTEADKGYTLTFPQFWQWQRDFMGLDVFATAPAKDEEIGSLANISVISSKIEEAISLETLFDTNINSLQRSLRNVQILERGHVILDGTDGRKVLYNHIMGDMNLRVLQYFIIKNGRAYILTCTASEPEFAKYADSFDMAIRSFKIENPETK